MVHSGIGTNSSHFGQGVRIPTPLCLKICFPFMSDLMFEWTCPPVAAHCAAYVEFAWFVAPHLCARGDFPALRAGALA